MKRKRIFLVVVFCLLLVLSGCGVKEQVNTVTSADGIEICYDVAGEGGPVLVFVHGWSCDKSYWKYQMAEFSQRHRVVAIDLGGHGESGVERENWTIESFGKDVAAVIDKLKLEDVILIGHSMGGPVVVEAALQEKEKVIAIVGADTFHDIEAGYEQEGVNEILTGLEADFTSGVDAFVRQMFPADADANLVDWVAADMSSANPAIALNAMRNLGRHDLKAAAEKTSVPFYSISADLWPTNFENNKQFVESFEVKMMEGVGHFVMLEDGEKFNQLLSEIIDEVKK